PSAPPRPGHRVLQGAGLHSGPPPAARGGAQPTDPSWGSAAVGHNVGVTEERPRPAGTSRARAFIARSIDDAQLARPALALTSLAVLCLMVLGGALLAVRYVFGRPGPPFAVHGA